MILKGLNTAKDLIEKCEKKNTSYLVHKDKLTEKKIKKGLKILIHFHLGHVLPKPILIVHFFQSNADNTDSIPVKIHERKLVKTRENYF